MALLFSGCASHDVNPRVTAPKTGYVDFYAAPPAEISWDIARFDNKSASFEQVFLKYAPHKGIVRLALGPGHYRLRIKVLNHATEGPEEVEVAVGDGAITPVRVELREAGSTLQENRNVSVGGTAYGRYGRRTRITSDETKSYEVSATPESPVPYRVKEAMPYH